jgi:hypothetical protein
VHTLFFGLENTEQEGFAVLFSKNRRYFPTFAQYCVIKSPLMIDHEDFSVVVKHRPPKSWRWEIYRAGRTSAIDHSEVYFDSVTEANRAGKAALKLMLSEYPD